PRPTLFPYTTLFRSLGGEDATGRAFDDRELLARGEAGALLGEFGHGDGRVGELEGGADDLPAGEDPVLAGSQRGAEAGVGGDGRLRGDVSPRGILGEGSADGGGDGVLGEHGAFRVLLRVLFSWGLSLRCVSWSGCFSGRHVPGGERPKEAGAGLGRVCAGIVSAAVRSPGFGPGLRCDGHE